MDKFNVINNQKFTVGKIQKQRINITHKKKGKALKQKDIKELLSKLMTSTFEIRAEHQKYWFVECLRLEYGLSKVMKIRLTQCLTMKMII